MNKILFENKVQVLERLVLQDIVASYGMQKSSKTSYDDLMAKLLDRMTRFYEELEPDAVSLQKLKQYGDRAKIYTEQLRADLEEAAKVTVRQIIKQLPREKLSRGTFWDATQAVRPVLKRRMEVLSNLLSASTLQMQNYMLLWDYQDAGYTHYKVLTDGDNCDRCNALEGQVIPITEARVGENFPPMHPNCNCWVELLDDVTEFEPRHINKIDKNEPDFYIGANQKVLPNQYKNWIGTNRQKEFLSLARNPQLQNAIKQLYRQSSFIGDGGTADVIRFEKETGTMLGRNGNSHITKGMEMAKYIETKILTQNLIPSDRTLAIQLLEDLNNAIGR